MKNTFIIFFLIFGSIILRAQNINITSFSPLPNDLTANTAGTEVKDQNGEKAALIRIQTTQTGFSFDAGMMGVVKTEQKIGEIWLYVPKGSKRITLRHQQLGTCEFSYPCPIESARTYEMKLVTGSVKTIVEEQETCQYVVFQVEPKDAIVTFDNEPLVVTNGVAQKYVPFGSYDYRVEAGDYHPEVGKVTVDNPSNNTKVIVNLKPAYGWIYIQDNDDVSGANVYVDNKSYGTAPKLIRGITSGQHRIKILKAMYKSWEQTVTVNEGDTTIVRPSLSANFCEVTFTVEKNAEIWIDGEKKGHGLWSGRLALGNHKLVTKLTHHRDASLTKSFSAEDSKQTVVLPAPKPIFGNVHVTTTPTLADITIDGKPYGQTPNFIRNILEGKHTVKISKSGYLTYSTIINVEEGQTVKVEDKLKDSDFEDPSPSSQPSLSFIEKKREKRTSFTVKGVTFDMIKVEGGTFTMGAHDNQIAEAWDNELPAKQVKLSSYYIGKYEVTQALWKAVMGSNPSYYKGNNLPVECVSWYDCQQFIKKLNKLTGEDFRLPKEEEWEYASRGGNKSKDYKYSGSNNLNDVAWYKDNSVGKTHDVGTKAPNELGIYDMSGNVWEWCWYAYGKYGVEPKVPESDSKRLNRGGCWNDNTKSCRSSRRDKDFPSRKCSLLGLRLVLPE